MEPATASVDTGGHLTAGTQRSPLQQASIDSAALWLINAEARKTRRALQGIIRGYSSNFHPAFSAFSAPPRYITVIARRGHR